MRAADLTIAFDPEPYEAAVVDAGLDAFNRTQVGQDAELLARVRRTGDDFDAGLALQKVGDEAILFALWVAPECRRQGVGTGLLEAAAALAASRGCRRITCGVYDYQDPPFFAARGFQGLARIEDLAHGHDFIVLRRPLGPPDAGASAALHEANAAEVGVLRRRIAQSRAETRDAGPTDLSAVLRDPARGPVGGVLGRLTGGEVYVETLWIDDALRGQGHGGRMLTAYEREAAGRGAARVTLDTFDFQAPAFYRARGYRAFGTVPDFLAGQTRHYFRKELRPA